MKEKWLVVSGISGGIGKSLIRYLLENEFNIIAIGSENSKNFADKLRKKNYSIKYVHCDYTSEASMENAFRESRKFTDSIHGAIHLVGGSILTKNIIDLSLEEFREVVELNLDSSFLFGREALKWMKDGEGGNIIFFGSTTGIEPSFGKLAYGVSKAAVHTMTLFFALEASKYDINVNTIAPSYVMTPRHKNDISDKSESKNVSEKEILDNLRKKNPLNKILDPKDLFPTIDLLLNTQSIQGQVIKVDLGQVGI